MSWARLSTKEDPVNWSVTAESDEWQLTLTIETTSRLLLDIQHEGFVLRPSPDE